MTILRLTLLVAFGWCIGCGGVGYDGDGTPVPEYWKGLYPCITGPGWPCMDCDRWLPDACYQQDYDFDGDVDLKDFAILTVQVSDAP